MPREQETIQYISDSVPCKVVLTSQVTDFFAHARALPEIWKKNGEELVSALMKHAKGTGAIFRVERYKNDKRNNGPTGEPAIEEFTEEGMSLSLYENGQRNDGAGGLPAYQRLNNDGVLLQVAHYKNGQRNDGANGRPAEQVFDHRGRPVYMARYKDDKQVNVLGQLEMEVYQDLALAKTAAVPQKQKAPAKKGKSPGM
jgi:hypothetical protein